jgi:hypothetical protein
MDAYAWQRSTRRTPIVEDSRRDWTGDDVLKEKKVMASLSWAAAGTGNPSEAVCLKLAMRSRVR